MTSARPRWGAAASCGPRRQPRGRRSGKLAALSPAGPRFAAVLSLNAL